MSDREDWQAYRREMWRRRRSGEWGGGPWRPAPGPFFGCLFVLIFLVFIVSLVAAAAAAVRQQEELPCPST